MDNPNIRDNPIPTLPSSTRWTRSAPVPAPDVSRSPRLSTGSSVRAIRTRFVKFASRIGVVPGTITADYDAFARHSCPGSGHSLAPLRVQPARSKETLFRPSRDLVDGDFVGDATQCAALRYRFEPAGFEQGGGLRIGDDGPGRQDRA